MVKLTPRHSLQMEMQTMGTVLSAMAFSLSILLGILALTSLRKKRAAPHNGVNRYLPAYVILMLLLSILSMIEEILSLFCFLFHDVDFFRLNSGAPVSLPLTIWGADGFMIWRCSVLYSSLKGRRRTLLVAWLSFLVLKSLAVGILALLPILGFIDTIVLIALTTTINLIIVTMIVLRLTLHQSYLTGLGLQEYRSSYRIIMSMCMESSALIVIAGASCIIAAIYNPHTADAIQVPMLIMPQICVISPVLIVYRVGQGQAAAEIIVQYESEKMEPLNFNPELMQSSNESAIPPIP